MKLEIHPLNPDTRKIQMAVEIIRKGGLVIFPTDTIYALGCDINNKGAIESTCRILGKKPEKANLSIICHDLSSLSEYTSPVNSVIFKLMRHCLPGPYTFILNASRKVPKLFQNNKKTVGIRIPDNNIARELVMALGNPLVSASVHSEDEIQDYLTDPEEIYEKYFKLADVFIDGGTGGNEPSTIIDCTSDFPEVIREGKGEVDF